MSGASWSRNRAATMWRDSARGHLLAADVAVLRARARALVAPAVDTGGRRSGHRARSAGTRVRSACTDVTVPSSWRSWLRPFFLAGVHEPVRLSSVLARHPFVRVAGALK